LNKGKLVGAKPPLRPKHVWSIRTKLQIAGRIRDLAMFNLAIDSKLRGCDVVRLRVEDVAPHGHAVDRATVRQKKTGQPVRFEMTEQTLEAVGHVGRCAASLIEPRPLIHINAPDFETAPNGGGVGRSAQQVIQLRDFLSASERWTKWILGWFPRLSFQF
jgi:hypothetical protein